MEGDRVDHRADLYSLGVTLFEMVTGKRPFSGETPIALISKRMKKSIVDPTEVREDTPQPVRELLLKMMGVGRDERFQTAAEMVEAIDAVQQQLTGKAPAVPVDLPAPSPSIVLDTPDPSLLIVEDGNVLSAPATPAPDSAAPTDAPPLTPAPAVQASKGSSLVPILLVVVLLAAGGIRGAAARAGPRAGGGAGADQG
jgi:serine/threonine protein kinase